MGDIYDAQYPDYGEMLMSATKKMMPTQKPGKSEQSVSTPEVFIKAVKQRLGISHFCCDLAADSHNAKAELYFDEATDSLKQDWTVFKGKGWCWLNPPFAKLQPWVQKCEEAAAHGVQIACLVPAAVGANWWLDWVAYDSYITILNGRIKFDGHKDYYPKDLALLLYAPYLQGGSCIWSWAK